MDIIFDGNYLYNKTFSVFSTYHKGSDMNEVLSKNSNVQILIRKFIIDMCFAINKFRGVEDVWFAFDSRSWRYTLNRNYKYALTRVRADHYESFLSVMENIKTLLRKKKFPVVVADGAEGDDIIENIATMNKEREQQTVIISADSDLRQLVSPHVSVFNNNSKTVKMYVHEDNDYWSDKLVDGVEIEVVDPDEILVYKILMGDTSDNIPKLLSGVGDVKFANFWSAFSWVFEEDGVKDSVENLVTAVIRAVDLWREGLKSPDDYVLNREEVEKNARMVFLSEKAIPEEVTEAILQDMMKNMPDSPHTSIFELDYIYGNFD